MAVPRHNSESTVDVGLLSGRTKGLGSLKTPPSIAVFQNSEPLHSLYRRDFNDVPKTLRQCLALTSVDDLRVSWQTSLKPCRCGRQRHL
ncbi:unnamed protein product [Hydatigera taeniaeformis]|uniref:Uncharacterized protein n=1 Tax=Hydatigena taeniaeformis TaxID=6205 RepID=A0A0R3X4G8_HYDTA|nr:unnamed protein product [Hydatigera taeniaeformis]